MHNKVAEWCAGRDDLDTDATGFSAPVRGVPVFNNEVQTDNTTRDPKDDFTSHWNDRRAATTPAGALKSSMVPGFPRVTEKGA